MRALVRSDIVVSGRKPRRCPQIPPYSISRRFSRSPLNPLFLCGARTFSSRYDKNHPSAVSLDAFDGAQMEPHVFREQLKRVSELIISLEVECTIYYSSVHVTTPYTQPRSGF